MKVIVFVIMLAIANPVARATEEDRQDGACKIYNTLCSKMKNQLGDEDEFYLQCVKETSLGINNHIATWILNTSGVTYWQYQVQLRIIQYVSGNEFTEQDLAYAKQQAALPGLEAGALALFNLKGRKKAKLVGFNTAVSCD